MKPTKKIDYDNMFKKSTGNTATHIAVDERLKNEDQSAYEEGFASSSGVRPETAETGGKIRHPEDKDEALDENRVHSTTEDENAGLAES